MSIIASYILPHSLDLIPEISGNKTTKLTKTIEFYNKVAEEIATLKPDTIVLASPHAESYLDYFQISNGVTISGSYGNVPSLNFRFYYDQLLIKEIARIAASNKFRATSEDEEKASLDHGSFTPLYFINKKYQDFKLVRLGVSGLSLLDHYKMGQIIANAAKNTNKRVVFIASGDMSHCLDTNSNYEFKNDAIHYEKLLNNILHNCNFGNLLSIDYKLVKKAESCGYRTFLILAGTLDKKNVSLSFYSHEAPVGTGLGIYAYKVDMEDSSRAFLDLYLAKTALSIKEKRSKFDPYTLIAYSVINQYLNDKNTGEKINIPTSMLNNQKGIIISLYEFGSLKARYASIFPKCKNTFEEIKQNALEACKNSISASLTKDDLPYLDIIVSEVESLRKISSLDEINSCGDALYIKGNNKEGYALSMDFVTKNSLLIEAKRNAGISSNEKFSIYQIKLINHE